MFYKRRGHKETQKEEGHVKAEAEIGVRLPQAKEHQRLPEKSPETRVREGFIYRFWREHGTAGTLILNFCCLKPPNLEYFVRVTLGNEYTL